MSDSSIFRCPPPEGISLPKNEVHIWLADLDHSDIPVQVWEKLLCKEERDRAKQFRFERDKSRFVIARGILRTIIGRYYFGIEPSSIDFRYGSRGKPFLKTDSTDQIFQFNESHSKSLALYGFVKEHDIGIDIEYRRPLPDAGQIIDKNCSPQEKMDYHSLSGNEKSAGFYFCWTRKEAFIKAIGEGLYYPLDQFDVSLLPKEPVRILQINGSREEAAEWTLLNIKPHDEYSGAVAIHGPVEKINFGEFPQKF